MIGRVGRIVFLRLLENEDLTDSIKKSAEKNGIKAGVFMLIGTLKHVTLGYYREKKYVNLRFDGPLEIASCTGNVITEEKGETFVHAHIVVSNERAEAFGGHLMADSIVAATAELMLIEASGVNLKRVLDGETGLRLMEPS
jgi:predicted DNA-binding protein with PD1-like motif